jgi:hypothetical protein
MQIMLWRPPLKRLISRSRVDLKNVWSQEVHPSEAGVNALLAAQVDVYVLQLRLSTSVARPLITNCADIRNF